MNLQLYKEELQTSSKTFDTLYKQRRERLNSAEIRFSAYQICKSIFGAGGAADKLPLSWQECSSVQRFSRKVEPGQSHKIVFLLPLQFSYV